MNVLIFEPDHTGHHLQYVKTMLPALAGLADRVTVSLSSAAPDSDEFRTHLSGLPREVVVDAWIPPVPAGAFAAARAKLAALRRSIHRSGAEHVFIPYADGLAQLLGLPLVWKWAIPRGVQVEGLMLRGPFAYPHPTRRKGLQHRVSWRLASRSPWYRLHVLDPLVYERVRRDDPTVAIALMPDPVEPPGGAPREQVLRRLGVPADGRYIGTAGLLHPSKGVEQLARAFAASNLGQTDRLLLAGRLHPAVRQMLERETGELIRCGRIQMIDRILETQDLADVIAAMDVVCVPYARHIGSSSIVIRAAAGGRPVLASDFGWCGEIVPRFDLGWTADMTNPQTLPAAITMAMQHADQYRPTAASRRFVDFHTPANFARAWAQGLRQRLNRGQEGELQTWEKVVDASSTA